MNEDFSVLGIIILGEGPVEIVGQINGIFPFLVGVAIENVVEDLIPRNDAGIADIIHIPHGNFGRAEIVDEIVSQFRIGPLRHNPTVKPHGASVFGDGEVQLNPCGLLRLVNGVSRVAAPGLVDVNLPGHDVGFAAVHFQTVDVVLHGFQSVPCGSNILGGGAVHQIAQLLAVFFLGEVQPIQSKNFFPINLGHGGDIGVPHGVLEGDTVFVLGIPHDLPGLGVFFVHVFGIVDNPNGTPHIAYGVSVKAVFFEDLLDVGRNVVVIIFQLGIIEFFQRQILVGAVLGGGDHFLDHVVRGTDQIVLRFSRFQGIEHGFVGFEGIVLNPNLDPRAGVVIRRPIFEDRGRFVVPFVDIILPVIDPQDPFLLGSAGGKTT